MQNFLTVRQLAEKYPAFSESSLRYHLFHAQTNNLERAVRRVGRKILISEPLFIEWIDRQGGVA